MHTSRPVLKVAENSQDEERSSFFFEHYFFFKITQLILFYFMQGRDEVFLFPSDIRVPAGKEPQFRDCIARLLLHLAGYSKDVYTAKFFPSSLSLSLALAHALLFLFPYPSPLVCVQFAGCPTSQIVELTSERKGKKETVKELKGINWQSFHCFFFFLSFFARAVATEGLVFSLSLFLSPCVFYRADFPL